MVANKSGDFIQSVVAKEIYGRQSYVDYSSNFSYHLLKIMREQGEREERENPVAFSMYIGHG